MGKSKSDLVTHPEGHISQPPLWHSILLIHCVYSLFISQHGIDSEVPIKYSHIDIAGSSGPFPGIPTGAPVAALTAKYILGL